MKNGHTRQFQKPAHMCVFEGKVSFPSRCSVFMASVHLPEELSICWGRKAESKQGFALQLLISQLHQSVVDGEEGEGGVVKDTSG